MLLIVLYLLNMLKVTLNKWHEILVYPTIETGFAFKPLLHKIFVNAFNNQTFSQDCIGPARLGIIYYNPLDPIFQHLPVKERVKNIDVNRTRNGYIIDTLTSVDVQEKVEVGGKVIQI